MWIVERGAPSRNSYRRFEIMYFHFCIFITLWTYRWKMNQTETITEIDRYVRCSAKINSNLQPLPQSSSWKSQSMTYCCKLQGDKALQWSSLILAASWNWLKTAVHIKPIDLPTCRLLRMADLSMIGFTFIVAIQDSLNFFYVSSIIVNFLYFNAFWKFVCYFSCISVVICLIMLS